MPRLRPVVLSGGSGTRLWPLSTAEMPKQFAPLIGDRSLFGLTLDRIGGLPDLADAIVVTGEPHVHLVAQAVAASPVSVGSILVEPVGRNTAPAALAAALMADSDDVLVILPSDHLIADLDGFRDAVIRAAEHATAGSIVTFGVKATRPETGYGYIEVGEKHGDANRVARFKEKPDSVGAAEMVADGRHLWNSGMFVTRAADFLEEAGRLMPEDLALIREAVPDPQDGPVRLGEAFREVEPISLDHAIMERTKQAVVLSIDVGWDDIGSLKSLLEALPRDSQGNHSAGDVTVSEVTGSLLMATSRKLVVSGLEDVAVIETPDAVLVVPLALSQDVRELQERANEE